MMEKIKGICVWKVAFIVLAGIMIFMVVTSMTTKAKVTSRLDPESGAATCPAGFGLEDFEGGTDGYIGGGGPIVSKIPGVEFVTTDGYNWLIGDWGSGYNGKYPRGAYTSGGQKWAWLGTAQGSGIIDFTDGLASYVSVYTSTYSGLILEAYSDEGILLETSNWADRNIRTGTMTQLSISRPTADIGYVIVHDTGNFWLIDWLCVSKGPSAPQTVQNVDIDIKPGETPNSINRNSKGSVPVAILGSETFDVATVLSDTVIFDDASPDKAGKSKTEKSPEDVNGDGYQDLVFHFNIQSLRIVNVEPVSFRDSTNEACLTGSTSDGTRFKGCDSVKLVEVPGGDEVIPLFLIIDEDSIDNGNPPNFFSAEDVNDDIADIGLRTELSFFAANKGSTIVLHTGEVGDEGWFALKSILKSWAAAGPTSNGLSNFILAGPGLGSPDSQGDREALLDKIPDVIPLRATGLKLLEGRQVCAVVHDDNISINYSPLNGSLKGAKLGTVAFEVISVTALTGFSSSALPQVEIKILDADEVCQEPLTLFTKAPKPVSSSKPFDVTP